MSDYKSDAKATRGGKMKSMGCYADGGTVADDRNESFPGGVMYEMGARKEQMDRADPQQNKGQGPTPRNAIGIKKDKS